MFSAYWPSTNTFDDIAFNNAFMPEWIRKTGELLPTRWMFDLIKGGII